MLASSASISESGGGDSGVGSGSGGGNGGGGDSGSSGGDSAGDEGDAQDEGGGLLKGWRERVAADPEFTFKVMVEQVISPSGA